MVHLSISKLDAAKRQLETSIRMFLRGEDPVSIHTLAAAAHQVLWDIAKKRNVKSVLKNNSLVRKEFREEFDRMVAKTENFFKHADRDPDCMLDFNSETTPYFLVDAIDIFQQLDPKPSPIMVVMRVWFVLKYPHIVLNGDVGPLEVFLRYARAFDPEEKHSFLELEEGFRQAEMAPEAR